MEAELAATQAWLLPTGPRWATGLGWAGIREEPERSREAWGAGGW